MDEIPKLDELKELFNNVREKLADLYDNYFEIDKNQNNQEFSKDARDQWKRDLFDLKWIISRLKENPVELINKLYKAGDRLYCLSVYDILSNAIKILYDADKNNAKEIYDRVIWLGEYLYKHDFDQPGSTEQEKPDYPKINKEYLHKLDGMDVLLTNLGEDKFIQLALAGSYFFDPKLVKKATLELSKKFNNGTANELPMSRYTTNTDIKGQRQIKKGDKAVVYKIKDSTTSNRELKFKVDIDVDGNRAVRDLITNETGVTVSQGKKSVLQNTIISHVWGRAYDPRYFTSLWNIVLIPAWANSLMDKEDAPERTLASKMRATYMTICTQLYNSEGGVFPQESNKNKDSDSGPYLSQLPNIANEDDAISEICTYNIISGNDNDKIVISKKHTSLIRVGKLAKKIIPIIKSEKFDNNELDSLLTKDRKKREELFGLSYPALVKSCDIFDRERYYMKEKIRIKDAEYYLCSQWYERNRSKLLDWLNNHK